MDLEKIELYFYQLDNCDQTMVVQPWSVLVGSQIPAASPGWVP